MRRIALLLLATTALLVPATSAFAGHGLNFDHAYPSFSTGTPDPTFQAGGNGASWELVATFPTGNPHTDIDFFTRDGETYVSAGTLGAGPNGGGQTILRLTDRGEVRPAFVAGHPSAACPSNPNSTPGLQHDVEATPKGGALLNTDQHLRGEAGHAAPARRERRRRALSRQRHLRPVGRAAGRPRDRRRDRPLTARSRSG